MDADARFDLLIIGSGVAGLSAAVVAAAAGLRVGVLTKDGLSDGTTRWAQGGVAAALSPTDDSVEAHFADTLAAGGDLCDPDAVRVLVSEGPARIDALVAIGAVFDTEPDGGYAFAREGGHSAARVIHAGGSATGAEIARALDVATRASPIEVLESWFAFELLVEGGRCVGVRGIGPGGAVAEARADHVLLAAGGAGQLFAVTTNPVQATGDGTAMALRAGVAVADMEFMQFHPTALHVPRMPRPLLTEALRGHGAVLRDPDGERFVDELQPRDVVSRAETAVMLERGVDHVWLDATGLDDFARRFPNIAADLHAAGLDPSVDWLPVAPAAHYLSGGVVTDLSGATELPGLWAAGEAACSGVHGANRLASNSLLEGLVFGPRAVEAIVAGQDGPRVEGAMRSVAAIRGSSDAGDDVIGGRVMESPGFGLDDGEPCSVPRHELDATRAELQRLMTFDAGVLRSAASLARASDFLEATVATLGRPVEPGSWELANLCAVGRALVAAAVERAESRGAHTRTDFPITDPTMRYRLVFV